MSEKKLRWLLRIGIVAAIVGIACSVTVIVARTQQSSASASEVSDVMAEVETYTEDYMPGQPLDAVKLSAPSFASGMYCYRVTDRTTGACWYLVQMPDGDGHWRWQVLTVGVGQASPGLIVPNNERAEVAE